MNNQADFNQLIDDLKEEYKVYHALHSALERKQKAIISGEVDQLRAIITTEQSMVNKTMKISKRRNAQVKQLMLALGLTGDLTLSRLIEYARRDQQLLLINLRDQLQQVVEKIQGINNQNRYLLNSSIDFIQGLVKLFLQGNQTVEGLYAPQGQVNIDSGTNKMFDYQI